MVDIDSPLDQQERHIVYGTGVYFVIIIGLIILTADLQASITEWFKNNTGEIYKDYLSLASVVSISFAIGYFIKYLGIHKYTDKMIFGFDQSLNKYITDSLKEFLARGNIVPWREILDREWMDIFFEFINKQENSEIVQRALFFSYYTKYGLPMNLFILSLLGFGIIYGLNLNQDANYSVYSNFAYGFLITIATVAILVSQLKIRREIADEITRRQIYRIVYDNQCELKGMIEKRFNTQTKYMPRIYKESKSRIKPSNVFIKVIASMMIAGGIILTSIGISSIYIAPPLSDFKATFSGSQTNSSSQTIPAETNSINTPTWFVFPIGIGLLVSGIFLKVRLDSN